MNTLEDVKQFHNTFDQPVLDTPQIPSKDRCELRINLISEELRELKVAIVEADIVEIADALCDLQYVLSGTILEFGLADKFPDLFAEVQRSNMSKACATEEEAIATVNHYNNLGQQSMYYKQPFYNKFKKFFIFIFSGFKNKSKEVYLVNRCEDKKLLKSINYSPADLRSILKK